MEYYSVTMKNEIMSFAGRALEIPILFQPAENFKCFIISHICGA
jgi:hypothetical protein